MPTSAISEISYSNKICGIKTLIHRVYLRKRNNMCIDAHTRDHYFASLGTTYRDWYSTMEWLVKQNKKGSELRTKTEAKFTEGS